VFAEGTRISITADPAPAGSHFVNWTSTAGDDIFDDPAAANTTFTMPANATTITAHYAPTPYALTVDGGVVVGTSETEFVAGATVSITADTAPDGYYFAGWTSTAGDDIFDDPTAASTTFTMPASATTITANYAPDTPAPPPAADTYVVIDLSGGTSAATYPVDYLADVPAGGWTDEYKTTKLVLRRIPAGTFLMGSPEGELGRDSDETQHEVTHTQDYYIGVFPVTQKQYELVVGSNPSAFSAGDNYGKRPVECVSWNDITATGSGFLALVSAKSGLDFRLPTEAQWEYACRAGTTTALNSGEDLESTGEDPAMNDVGRYYPNGGSSFSSSDESGDVGTAFVGTYEPNAWGLYDFHGNVREWCADWYGSYGTEFVVDPTGPETGDYRVLRGGGWYYGASVCRSASRSSHYPYSRIDKFGFRVACVPASP
ncbi:MAG: SUMF1/EgtB/PvdO family nonheme iron enzyme, partial [Puniceicoccales bacterium]|nr:SUMF1/EgtB/PvdO family nonheme iron enzyme [Puniceicoccales bacterium]